MRPQPLLCLFSVVRRYVVQNNMDPCLALGSFDVNVLQQVDQFHLTFASCRRAPDMATPCVKGRKQTECSTARIFLFVFNRTSGGSGTCVAASRTRLETRHFVHAQHHFVRFEVSRVEIADGFDPLSKRFIPWHPG